MKRFLYRFAATTQMYVPTIRDLITDYLFRMLTGVQQEFLSGTMQQQQRGATGGGNFTISKEQGAQIGQLKLGG